MKRAAASLLIGVVIASIVGAVLGRIYGVGVFGYVFIIGLTIGIVSVVVSRMTNPERTRND
jgi:hypothetical protein